MGWKFPLMGEKKRCLEWEMTGERVGPKHRVFDPSASLDDLQALPWPKTTMILGSVNEKVKNIPLFSD